jgi:hypothetical protein
VLEDGARDDEAQRVRALIAQVDGREWDVLAWKLVQL